MRFKHLPVDAGRQTDKALEVVGEVALVGKACQKSRLRITAKKTGDMAAIAFTDNGAGVQPEQLPRLFDVFYRGDAARTAPGKGSGIGLAVVKKACDEMHGTVRAENAENGGLRGTVSALVNRW